MPLWKMQGTADYDVDFYFSATVSEEDGEGAETVTITHCTGKKTYKVEAQIFKDLVIKLD